MEPLLYNRSRLRIAIDARKIGDFGIGTYAEGLLRGLAELEGPEDYVVFVATRFRERVPQRFETVAADVPNYSIREQFAVARLIERSRADLFHSLHFVLPLTAVPSVVTVHDVIPLHFPYRNPIARLYYGTMLRRGLTKSRRVCTVTESAKREIVSATGCDAGKIFVTPNGVDAIADEPPAEGRYFLFVGNDKPHKNVERLISAFDGVRRNDRSVDLVMAGGSFEHHARRDGIRSEGFVSNERLAALYRGALALIIPSLDEGFGLPALEAMSCGTPVIASNIPALVEVTGDAAVHVDPKSVEGIAGAMRRVAADTALRKSLGRRGIERARQFTWRRCAEETVRVYREVLA